MMGLPHCEQCDGYHHPQLCKCGAKPVLYFSNNPECMACAMKRPFPNPNDPLEVWVDKYWSEPENAARLKEACKSYFKKKP